MCCCAGHANSVTLLWDKIMTSLHCCGVSGYGDFPAGVPASCCLDTAAPGANTTLAGACPDTPTAQMDTGCFSILFLGSVPAIASSLAVVALFQVISATLHLDTMLVSASQPCKCLIFILGGCFKLNFADCWSYFILLPGTEG